MKFYSSDKNEKTGFLVFSAVINSSGKNSYSAETYQVLKEAYERLSVKALIVLANL